MILFNTLVTSGQNVIASYFEEQHRAHGAAKYTLLDNVSPGTLPALDV